MNDYIAATSSYDLFKLKLLPAVREVFEHVFRNGRYWSGDKIMELRNPATGKFEAERADDPMWGRIVLRSASSGSGLESLTAKAAILDECGMDDFALESWEAVLRRLSLSQGRVLGGTTVYNLGWTKTEVYDKWRAGDPNYRVVQFDSTENPMFPMEEYERAKATMPEHRFLMFYRGQFSRPAGQIYGCFTDDHFVDPFPIPAHWPIYGGLDFGGANTAKLWVAENPETNCYFVYREMLDGDKETGLHVRDYTEKTNENLVRVWGGSPSETQQRMDWTAAGLHVSAPPISDVEAGISRVIELANGHRLYIFKTMSGLRDEIGTYRRKVDIQGQTTEEIVAKRTFHRLDALRYFASGVSNPRVLEFA